MDAGADWLSAVDPALAPMYERGSVKPTARRPFTRDVMPSDYGDAATGARLATVSQHSGGWQDMVLMRRADSPVSVQNGAGGEMVEDYGAAAAHPKHLAGHARRQRGETR